MEDASVREKLLKRSAIQIVARDGLEKTTTKKIATNVDLNEVYIYRCFLDKEDLLKKVFLETDRAFLHEVQRRLEGMISGSVQCEGFMDEKFRQESFRWGNAGQEKFRQEKVRPEDSLETLWKDCWDFLLKRPEQCLFYTRYYYSASYDAEVQQEHRENCQELLELFVDSGFVGLQDTTLLYILELMWNFAAKVAQGIWVNTEETSEQCREFVFAVCRNTVQNAKQGAMQEIAFAGV